MDDTKVLFNRIKNKDNSSFHLLTETYGWKLYSYIRRSTTSREVADRIFNETLSRFHSSVGKYECEDPIEAMLCLYADEIGQEDMHPGEEKKQMGSWEIAHEHNFSLPSEPQAQKRERTKGNLVLANILYAVCITLLIAGILIALWFLVGILVDMKILPETWDLGYTWFNTHVANWF